MIRNHMKSQVETLNLPKSLFIKRKIMSQKIQNSKWSQFVFRSVHQLLDQFLWLVLYVIEPTGWYTTISYQS